MIELLPFYMSLNAPLHAERLKDDTSTDNNFHRRYSISLLNSLVPTLADFAETQVGKYGKCVVISTPAPNETLAILRYIRDCVLSEYLSIPLTFLYNIDLMPRQVDYEEGLYVGTIPTVMNNVSRSHSIVSYFPVPVETINSLHKRTDQIVLCSPMNIEKNWYAKYIEVILSNSHGIQR